jgi:hypothetical protein
VAAGYLINERPLLCGMCHRRICDIAVNDGDVFLLRVAKRQGIPEKVPEGRVPRLTGGGRDPNVRIFADESGEQNRFRFVHHHKRGGRGPLDRTITAATLHKLYDAVVTAGSNEVVLG